MDRLREINAEMLEALECLNAELVNGQNVPSLGVMQQIRRAIAKAKGEL